jgi:cellulose biosynthesis protein BcsQ
MSTIVVASAIGGAGKTTASLCIAAALAKIEADTVPTVLLDLDPAGDATRRMGLAREGAVLGPLLDGRRGARDAMGGYTVLDAAQQTSEGFAVVPSSDDIALVEREFSQMAGGTALLIYRLHALGRGCRLVVDTAPGITTFLGRAVIVAADVVIVPVIPRLGAFRRVLDVVGLLRGMGGKAHVLVVAAQTDGKGDDFDALNDDLRNERLVVNEWFPSEPDVARSASATGTPLKLVPASQCARSYVVLAQKIEEAVAQRQHLKPTPSGRS